MAWAHRFKPPSGTPARGVGKGDGWGGPAQGAHPDGAPFTADSPTRHRGPGDPKKMAERAAFAAEKAARVEQLLQHLGNLALNAKREETQVSATVAALNRLDGLPPTSGKLDLNGKMTLEGLVAASLAKKDDGEATP